MISVQANIVARGTLKSVRKVNRVGEARTRNIRELLMRLRVVRNNRKSNSCNIYGATPPPSNTVKHIVVSAVVRIN